MRTFYQPLLKGYHDADDAEKKLILQRFAKALLQAMPYTKDVTHVGMSAAESFDLAAGVCQDHSHVFIACLRDMGIPARYVSGYLYDVSAQHMASHAWAEAWIDSNWYTFDVSNQHFTPNAHVYVAIGRDYLDAAPVRGIRLGGGYESMNSQVLVSQIHEQ